jgi:hypothetical protein
MAADELETEVFGQTPSVLTIMPKPGKQGYPNSPLWPVSTMAGTWRKRSLNVGLRPATIDKPPQNTIRIGIL